MASMLANPVVVPPYADPRVWGFALLAMWAEVYTVMGLLRRFGSGSQRLLAPLVGINLATWMLFLVGVDCADRCQLPMVTAITVLEGLVVLVEAVLLHAMTRVRLFSRGVRCEPLTWSRAFFVSLVGNLVSIAVSIALPCAFAMVLRLLG